MGSFWSQHSFHNLQSGIWLQILVSMIMIHVSFWDHYDDYDFDDNDDDHDDDADDQDPVNKLEADYKAQVFDLIMGAFRLRWKFVFRKHIKKDEKSQFSDPFQKCNIQNSLDLWQQASVKKSGQDGFLPLWSVV